MTSFMLCFGVFVVFYPYVLSTSGFWGDVMDGKSSPTRKAPQKIASSRKRRLRKVASNREMATEKSPTSGAEIWQQANVNKMTPDNSNDPDVARNT